VDQLLLFTLLGLGTGALIAGIGLGVVLTYRGSGVINVATGAEAMAAGYAFYSLRTVTATPLALIGTLAFTIALGVAIELLAFRPLRTSSPLARLVSSLGVLLTLQAAMLLAFGTASKPQPSVLPGDLVTVFGVDVPVDRFLLAGIVVVAATVLAAAYRWSRFGLATRAASENEVSAMLVGLSPTRLSMANTLLACLAAGGLGVLAASITQLNSQTLPLQIVPALAAALLARFTSFAIACAAGLLIGMAENVLYYLQTQSWFPTDHGIALPGVQQLFVFAVIVVAMFWRGASLPGRGELIEKRLPVVPRPERPVRTAAIGGAARRSSSRCSAH
jgi:branched-subunit amino acid ABC-type transport system permease component